MPDGSASQSVTFKSPSFVHNTFGGFGVQVLQLMARTTEIIGLVHKLIPKIYLVILSWIIIQGSITAWIRHYSTSLSRVEKRGPWKRGFECFCKDLPAKDGGERRDWDSHIFIFISILRFFPVIILLILKLLALSSLLDDSLLEALSLSTIVWKHHLRKATCQPNMTYLTWNINVFTEKPSIITNNNDTTIT